MIKTGTKYVACFGFARDTAAQLLGRHEGAFHFLKYGSLAEFLSTAEFNRNLFKAVLIESTGPDDLGQAVKWQLEKAGYGYLPFCVLADNVPPAKAKAVLQSGVAEVFTKPAATEVILKKLSLIIGTRAAGEAPAAAYAYKMPLEKRLFDVLFASLALLLLSPVFLLVAALIRIESRGPVFYYSLRVGTGYRIFRFYKFRSMSVDADKKLSGLKHLNQYAAGAVSTAAVTRQCDACAESGAACNKALYADNEMWCEKIYKQHLAAQSGQAFVKIKDDPRITRIGKLIRNTSIDELPQLWNVLKGDMSVVGNRPLPLYEAEKLTTDRYALRFMAPAGITGLWQVSKRGGKGAMSEDERISLDNDYAKSYGLLFDLKLIFRTIPALLQKENV